MTVIDADLLTEVYALRSRAGVIRTHAERCKSLRVAARMAEIQENTSQLISELETVTEPCQGNPSETGH